MGADLYFMRRDHRERTWPIYAEAIRKAIELLEDGETHDALVVLREAYQEEEGQP